MRRFLLLLVILSLPGCGQSEEGASVVPAEEDGSGASIDGGGGPEAGTPGDSSGVRGSPDAADALTGEGSQEVDSLSGVFGPSGSEAQVPPPTFQRPEKIRGIYLNAWTAGSSLRLGRLIDLAGRTELNSFVIDIKDATGFISHRTQLPLAREVGATGEVRIRDLPGMLRRLKDAGIYPIARIVVAKDPLLTSGRPDLAIQDSAGGVWLDQDSVSWLNFHHRTVWEYHVALAKEVTQAGFPEIQWDYVRFPDAPEAFRSRAVFPGQEGRTMAQAVRGFLGYSREVLGEDGVQVTADVFGVTTSYRRDVGIGQVWESFIDQVDVALPMVYPSHYWKGSFGFDKPNAFPYEIVRRALRDAVSRSKAVEGAGLVRPWLQDFTLGDPPYGSPEVRAQIQATYDAGVEEWILWNPGSRYTESALMPASGLPSWLEPVMRVGGEVVSISKRFEVLGEEDPTAGQAVPDTVDIPEVEILPVGLPGKVKTLPPVPLPDTGGVAGGR